MSALGQSPPARLAAARVPHPLSWQRAARPHACASVAATPKFEAKRCGASDHNNTCIAVSLTAILPHTLLGLLSLSFVFAARCPIVCTSLSRRSSAALTALQELLYQSLQALVAFESVTPEQPPPEQLQPCRLLVPSHPFCPCAAVRAGGLPAASSVGQPLARGVRADPRRGHQRAGWQQGGMGGGRSRWKRPFDFPIPDPDGATYCRAFPWRTILRQ